jgi:hypothetical protein
MTTNTTFGQIRVPAARRCFAALGAVLLLGVFFVLPLCAALSLCAMPCCHHESDPAGALAAGEMPGCATECAISSDDAIPAAVASLLPDSGAHRTLPAVVAVSVSVDVAPPATPLPHEGGFSHRGADASLNVLNSVFRI